MTVNMKFYIVGLLTGCVVKPLSMPSNNEPVTVNVLKSSDGYTMLDFNGLYIIPKETVNVLKSSDGYTMLDFNGLYIIPKESE